MEPVRDIADLDTLYGDPVPTSLTKVVRDMTPSYRAWIEAARFVILATVGPEGTDASPRGDDGAVLRILDDRTLLMPDWSGNNRVDSLRNIVRDPRVSLMLMVPGSGLVVRVNGNAIVTSHAGLMASFERDGRRPKSVVAITIGEMYFQCPKAIRRSGIWEGGDVGARVPNAAEFLDEVR